MLLDAIVEFSLHNTIRHVVDVKESFGAAIEIRATHERHAAVMVVIRDNAFTETDVSKLFIVVVFGWYQVASIRVVSVVDLNRQSLERLVSNKVLALAGNIFNRELCGLASQHRLLIEF